MSRSEGREGQRCEEDEGWVPAVVLEAEGDSSAVDCTRWRRSTHNTRLPLVSVNLKLAPAIDISTTFGGRE